MSVHAVAVPVVASPSEALRPQQAAPPAVRLYGICKRFGAVQANDNVALSIAAGSIHGLVGENGAGKSTLMSILYGFYNADAGEIEIAGQPVTIRDAHDAIRLGIGMVHQHFMLVDNLSALDNVMLGAEPHALLSRSEPKVRAALDDLMQRTGLHVALDRLVQDLPVGDRQRLEILKTLYRGAKVLILDEPTAVLTPQETMQLFGVLRKLKEQGTTIVLITHKLKEVMNLCDRVTVMRAGRVVHECAVSQTRLEDLAEAMVGRKVKLGREGTPPTHASADGALLSVEGLSYRDAQGVMRLNNVSLALHSGEIVGIAGVSGNGQSELLELLAGLLRPSAGKLRVATPQLHQQGSAPVRVHEVEPSHWLNPRQARDWGIAHVAEERHARAMVPSFSAWETAMLGYDNWPQYVLHGWLRIAEIRAATATLLERFDVRPRNCDLKSGQFSGGNQQKLVLARELGAHPSVLLVGQPTRGVDIGAIEFIYGQLRELRQAGCAVLLVSSELDEILALADRVLVMYQGRISGELGIEQCDELKLGLMMTGSSAAGTPTESAAATA